MRGEDEDEGRGPGERHQARSPGISFNRNTIVGTEIARRTKEWKT